MVARLNEATWFWRFTSGGEITALWASEKALYKCSIIIIIIIIIMSHSCFPFFRFLFVIPSTCGVNKLMGLLCCFGLDDYNDLKHECLKKRMVYRYIHTSGYDGILLKLMTRGDEGGNWWNYWPDMAGIMLKLFTQRDICDTSDVTEIKNSFYMIPK